MNCEIVVLNFWFGVHVIEVKFIGRSYEALIVYVVLCICTFLTYIQLTLPFGSYSFSLSDERSFSNKKKAVKKYIRELEKQKDEYRKN